MAVLRNSSERGAVKPAIIWIGIGVVVLLITFLSLNRTDKPELIALAGQKPTMHQVREIGWNARNRDAPVGSASPGPAGKVMQSEYRFIADFGEVARSLEKELAPRGVIGAPSNSLSYSYRTYRGVDWRVSISKGYYDPDTRKLDERFVRVKVTHQWDESWGGLAWRAIRSIAP